MREGGERCEVGEGGEIGREEGGKVGEGGR